MVRCRFNVFHQRNVSTVDLFTNARTVCLARLERNWQRQLQRHLRFRFHNDERTHQRNSHLDTRILLTVESLYGSPMPSSGWMEAGTSVLASVTPPVPTETRYVCAGWNGTGSVPASGTDTSANISITQPSSLTWNWKIQAVAWWSNLFVSSNMPFARALRRTRKLPSQVFESSLSVIFQWAEPELVLKRQLGSQFRFSVFQAQLSLDSIVLRTET